MWVSGLRGAMAYALALKSYYDFKTGNGDILLVLTMLISQATVVGAPILIHPIIELCGVKNLCENDFGTDVIEDSGMCTWLKRSINCLHEKTLKGIFDKESLIPSTPINYNHERNSRPPSSNLALSFATTGHAQIHSTDVSPSNIVPNS